MITCSCTGTKCRLAEGDRRHGTENGYINYACRCEPCRAAHTDITYQRKQRRLQKPVPDHVHGTANGYGNYGCRCVGCTDAWSKDCLDRTHRRRAGLTDCALGLMPAPQYRHPERPRHRYSSPNPLGQKK